MLRRSASIIALSLSLLSFGCDRGEPPPTTESLPRPVTVISLQKSNPSRSQRVAGAVASWKTEDIGFEVTGRVEYVVEPETEVDGYIGAANGGNGSVLARLDSSRYQIQIERSEAQITTLQRQKDAAIIEVERVVPAEQQAAQAELDLATAEYTRNKRLFDEKAISQAELDKAIADQKRAQAQVAQLAASLLARQAEVTSLDAQIEQAQAALRDAQRDLDNCTLYAPFRGQVASVKVIPGGLVQGGEPVVTLQMMDPIKIEFEVSADRARELKYKDRIDVIATQPNGTEVVEEGIIYTTDTTADPATRTFTITVLLRNRKSSLSLPKELQGKSLPVTHDIWRLLQGLIDQSDRYFIPEDVIGQDSDGAFLWAVSAGQYREDSSTPTALTVEKLRIQVGEAQGSFLGLWTFREVSVMDGQSFDKEKGEIVGPLVFPDDSQDWSGGTVIFHRDQWLLRPGDLVGIDVERSGNQSGYYVPLSAIRDVNGQKSILMVEGEGDQGILRQVPVGVHEAVGSLIRIEPVETSSLPEGSRIVIGRTHFLLEGESVAIAQEGEVRP